MKAQSGWFSLNSGVNYNFTDVFFTDPNTGYVGTTIGKLLKTTNGGSNWAIFTYHSSDWGNSIFFINSQTGYIGGDFGRMYKTTNGGQTARAPAT